MPLRALLLAVGPAALTACAPAADRPAPPASPPSPPLPPVAAAVVAFRDTTVTAKPCLTAEACAEVSLTVPLLQVVPGAAGADSAAVGAAVARLQDTVWVLAGVPPGVAPQRHADRTAARLLRALRAHRRAIPDWTTGFSDAATVRVAWASSRVLTLEAEVSGYTGGAHGQYEAALRSWDVRTGAPIAITAVVADTAALVPLLERGFAAAKADSGAAPPPLSALLYPEVKRLPVAPNAGLVPEGVRFLYSPYEVASWAVGRTDVVLTWAQLGADARRWGG
jgi:hypothetical protein